MKTKDFYRTNNYNVDHSTYGGELNNFDFDGHHTLKSMSDRIMRDIKFDQMCKANAINRDRNREYKKGSR